MSLQGDFELCLEYAEKLEDKREQQVQAQNGISFVQSESERLKNKLRTCTKVSVFSAIGIPVLPLIMLGEGIKDFRAIFPFVGALIIVFVVSFFNRIKIKKESKAFEYEKPHLIQQYTKEVEDCQQEIVRLVEEIYYEDLLDIVPEDYFSVAAIEFCLTQVRKKLANTATEAFRLLDAEIKRLEQLDYLEQMNNAQMEQLNDIKRAIHINTLVTLAEHEKNNS